MHPSIPALLRYFEYDHLPMDLQEISQPFHTLAHEMVDRLGHITDIGPGAQLNRGLQKLLESRDAMVRAALGRAQSGFRYEGVTIVEEGDEDYAE